MALINENTIEIDATISRTDTCLIKITEDKLVNILTIHVEKLKKSKEWLAALSFSASLLLVLITSKFNARWGISADTWQALFMFLFGASVIYLIYSIYNCIVHKDSVDIIMKHIKGEW